MVGNLPYISTNTCLSHFLTKGIEKKRDGSSKRSEFSVTGSDSLDIHVHQTETDTGLGA